MSVAQRINEEFRRLFEKTNIIELSEEEQQQTVKQIQTWFKHNLAQTYVYHPDIGRIFITNTSFKETRHYIGKKYVAILLKLKQLIETSKTDGELKPLTKHRKDNAEGFYYLTNEIKINDIIFKLFIEILVDNQGNRYYMFTFNNKQNENYNLFRCPSLVIDGSIIVNNIITENIKNVNIKNQNFDDVKVGDVFMVGDCIKMQVIKINKENDNDY